MIFRRQAFGDSRRTILAGSVVLAVLAAVGTATLDRPAARASNLSSLYALISLGFLYLSLLVTPLYAALPWLPGRSVAIYARRAIGASCFFFAVLHAALAWGEPIGGLEGLTRLTRSELWGAALGLFALVVLAMLTATSFDAAVRRMGRRWRTLHSWVYPAWWALIIHTFIFSFHSILFLLVLALLILQAWRTGHDWRHRGNLT